MEDNKKSIDFNCDLAQFFAGSESEFEMVDYVSSVNISTGVHAGNALAMKKAMEFCNFKNKVVGAHIGFPEEITDGLALSEEEIGAMVIYQLGALTSFAKTYSMAIEHVRLHGEMYKLAATNLEFSIAVAKAINKFGKWLVYFGPAGEILEETAEKVNINIARELHLDRIYKTDGSIDFEQPEFCDKGKSLIRLRRLLNLSEIDNNEQGYTKVKFDTIHFASACITSLDLAKEANKIVIPKPVNYNNVEASGWV